MKSICALGLWLFMSIATIAQEKHNGKTKDKEEKQGSGNEAKIKEHERIIWTGTGINLNDKAKDAKHLPPGVHASFRQFFPDQPIDNVRRYRGLYAITFSNAVYTTTLIYKPDGTFVEARTVATESVLPAVVKEKLNKKAGYTTRDVVVIENANKQKFYRVRLNKDDNNEYLFYDEDGDVIAYDY